MSTTSFRAACFIRKHPDLIPQYEKTLNLLEIDPFHTSLRLHRLKGSLCDLHPVSINISYRITLELVIQGGKEPFPDGNYLSIREANSDGVIKLVEQHKQTGDSLFVRRDGEMVWLKPERFDLISSLSYCANPDQCGVLLYWLYNNNSGMLPHTRGWHRSCCLELGV